MITTSGTLSESPVSRTATSSGSASAPAPEDSSASFSDVLQQHESENRPPGTDSDGSTSASSRKPATKGAEQTPSTSDESGDGSGTSQEEPTPISVASSLGAISASKYPAKQIVSIVASTTSATPIAAGSNLSAMIAQASILPQGLRAASLPSLAAKSSVSIGKESPPASAKSGPSANLAAAIFTVGDLAAVLAQAATISSTALSSASAASTTSNSSTPAAPTALGNDLPLSGVAAKTQATSAKEKKSAASRTEGSFLQSAAASPSLAASLLGMLLPQAIEPANAIGGQRLAPSSSSKNVPVIDLSVTGSSLAGTANVEKEIEMNTTLNLPGFASNGLSPFVLQNSADLHIRLESNVEFEDALKQVMQVAQLTHASDSGTPLRVAIEIQTPPGAIVNVYVSRQNDQWRAQLSTNDPQALSWVQDKISSLRQSSDLGVEVRWLPAQIETIATTSHESNLDWNREGQQGQNQPDREQTDERRQAAREKRNGSTNAAKAEEFMSTIQSLGRAA